MAEKLVITQIKSGIRAPWRQQRTLEALGLRHHQMTVVHNDSPAIRGMLFKIRHLVKVTEEAGS